MARTLSLTRYVILIGVVGLLLGSLAGFIVSSVETAALVWHVLTNLTAPDLQVEEIAFIKLVDGFLVATGLLIFGLGLFEIFIHELTVPPSLRFTSIEQLKSSLANIIVLTLAVSFLAVVQEDTDPMNVVLKGAGISVMILALILFARSENESAGREP